MRPADRMIPNPPAPTNPAARDEPSVQQCRNKPGVLVVDDDRLVRIMLQLALERGGFEVWLASNGREALQLYRTHRKSIGVVLLDINMPGMDGLATFDALRRFEPEVRVCFMSGNTSTHKPEDLRQRGAVSVIAKPFLLNELVNDLRPFAHDVSPE